MECYFDRHFSHVFNEIDCNRRDFFVRHSISTISGMVNNATVTGWSEKQYPDIGILLKKNETNWILCYASAMLFESIFWSAQINARWNINQPTQLFVEQNEYYDFCLFIRSMCECWHYRQYITYFEGGNIKAEMATLIGVTMAAAMDICLMFKWLQSCRAMGEE